LSWNVFRYFDRSGQVELLLKHFVQNIPASNGDLIYWSYLAMDGKPWHSLLEARTEFGEANSVDQAATGSRVSEPDIILLTNDLLVFVEAKFGSGNETSGDAETVQRRIDNPKRYLSGGDEWYHSVFQTDFANVIQDQRYELLRFWLLGSWIARKTGRRFILANLVRDQQERDIENDFGKHIKQTPDRLFVRWTWESLRPLLETLNTPDSARLCEYLVNKTIGFTEDKRREVASPIKAFSLT
jgi:Holliday junction resolvase-like predicted endonuclease